jgi:predicted amidohydrolase
VARERTIAVAQTIPVRGDVEANLAAHLALVRIAAGEGARLVVFPELSLTGYELDLADRLAFKDDDPRLLPLREAARAHALTLIVGAPVRVGSRLHIGAFILPPDGTVGLYTKHHLGAFSASARVDGRVPPAEATVFAPGSLNPLVPFANGEAAVAICADTGRASHPQRAADRGATAYLASMFVIPSEFDREAATLQAYAARHSMVVAFANFGGPSGGLRAAGQSAIWSARGERLVQLDVSGAGVAVAIEGPEGWRARRIRFDGS